eukprot:1141284-Rhodomonas_salina.1
MCARVHAWCVFPLHTRVHRECARSYRRPRGGRRSGGARPAASSPALPCCPTLPAPRRITAEFAQLP